jgi:hypothetical protein
MEIPKDEPKYAAFDVSYLGNDPESLSLIIDQISKAGGSCGFYAGGYNEPPSKTEFKVVVLRSGVFEAVLEYLSRESAAGRVAFTHQSFQDTSPDEIRYATGEVARAGDRIYDGSWGAVVEEVIASAQDMGRLGVEEPGLMLKDDEIGAVFVPAPIPSHITLKERAK